ncbi:hypothetical protein [Furfurilactobacillus milii]|uniref:hypothetical protein n=1 Tax=Furfurilactobacillus milii TaxID=2888272 RepID=UPI001F2B7309|nr:hypothetical protein [Furfurilactobacillus milii]MCF6419427.1 hypothetical protein [Furfurilactobacillus milii]
MRIFLNPGFKQFTAVTPIENAVPRDQVQPAKPAVFTFDSEPQFVSEIVPQTLSGPSSCR